MNSTPPQTSIAASEFSRAVFAAAAATAAIFLLVVYVLLLQNSVARGAQLRFGQQTSMPGIQYGASPSIVVR